MALDSPSIRPARYLRRGPGRRTGALGDRRLRTLRTVIHDAAGRKSPAGPPPMDPATFAASARVAAGVFVLGGVGAVVRVVLASAVDRAAGTILPHAGTLAVNLLGCFLFGLLGALLSGTARVVVLGGLLGALTTYSTFAWLLTDLGREGRIAVLGLQLVLHLVGGLASVLLGLAVARAIGRLAG